MALNQIELVALKARLDVPHPVVEHLDVEIERIFERGDDAGNQAITAPRDALFAAIDRDLAREDAGAVGRAALLVINQLEMLGMDLDMVGTLESLPDI